ncbi:copper amine oxidase N-terminal domain-containing protein [Paenibacillus sp. 481]|uniref:copper amine oxidase N-terminal domain-containing protein n=1 Tax=Paenibacillus sp. 481 TaxID=2835869 RepID=UPI001E639D88|nr:copper amine oxidase N-terminal domain-containing protein [Paenibacillus sp. 481]UHA74084.1 hypothetical protein KIK04_02745 [Paenibacillus sp. 481]
MNCRRFAAVVLLGSLCFAAYSPVTANAQENASAEKIKVELNGNTIKEGGGYMIDGRAFLSVRDLEDALQAFIHWDAQSKKVSIEKPNVDLLLFQGNQPFAKVKPGKTSFTIFVQADSLKVDVDKIKLTITDHEGNKVDIEENNANKSEENLLWYTTKEFKYDFKTKGNYKIACYLRQKNGDYVLMAEKTVAAI